MRKVTEDMTEQFTQRRRRGDSYRAIADEFKLDYRTVKSGIQVAEEDRDRDHWEAVGRQVDVRCLEEHLGMLVRVSIDLQRAVQFSPLRSDREQPMGHVAATVATGLKDKTGVLQRRGVKLGPSARSAADDVAGRPPQERLTGKLLAGLSEHEPALHSLLDQWSNCWLRVQGERRNLQDQAIGLFGQLRTGEEVALAVAKTLGPAAVEQAIASTLSRPGPGPLTSAEGEDGSATLTLADGRKVWVIQKSEVEPVLQSHQWVVDQLRQDERIRPLQEAYRSLTETLTKIEDLVDQIVLRGRPRSACFLCPEDSRV